MHINTSRAHRVTTGLATGLAFMALAASTPVWADDAPATTPYRPTVAAPAALSAPGYLEVEAGAIRTGAQDPKTRAALNYSFKLAFSEDWGIRVGGEAHISQKSAAGDTLKGMGDTTVVLKRRFGVDDKSAFGLELMAKAPTAKSGLGSDKSDVGLNGIYSADIAGGWHTDLNLAFTNKGGMPDGVGRTQTGWAAGLSRGLNDQWGIALEVSGTRQSGVSSTGLGIAAASYSVSKALTLDMGVSKGMNKASGDWSFFTGLTMLTAKLF